MRISDWSSDVCSSDLAVVVQREVGDDLAPLQIEAAEVGQPLEAATLEHRAALAGVVEAHHRGQEHALTAAQHAQGVVKHQHVGPQVPLGGGTLQTFACAVAEPLVTGDLRAALPGLRSEEHTSELQSLMRISYAVFCLKKKTQP